jgi:hypothetical protein
MGIPIQWMPSDYMQRRPSRSESIMQGLEPLGKVASSYLNSKLDAFNEQQKEQKEYDRRLKSAKALSALPQFKKIEGLQDLLANVPEQHWEPILKQIRASDISGMNLSGDISNLLKATSGKRGGMGSNIAEPTPISQETPPPPEQQMPTAATTAANMAAMQRTGMNGMSYAPGTPEYMAAQGMQQPQQMLSQQPQDIQPEGKKPILLGDLDEQAYQNLRNTLPVDAREPSDKIRNNQLRTNASVTQAETAKEALKLKREIFNEQTKDLSKEDKKFVEKIDNSMTTLYKAANSLQQMKKIREETEIGPGYLIFAKNREAASQYNATSKDTLGLINDLFPRGFTASEFKRVEETWAAHAGETNDTLKGKEEGLSNVLLNASKLVEKMNSFQNPDGSYPKGIQNKVAKELYQSDEFQDFITQVKNGPQLTSGQSDKPFKATQIPEGYGMKDTKTGKIYVSKDGKLVEVE